MPPPLRIAVTGGAGFLGSHLVPRLVASGFEVTILDARRPPAWARDLPLRHISGDVRDVDAVSAALTDADVVVHAAFASPHVSEPELRAVNVGGTAVVCRTAVTEGVPRVVLVSSTIVERRIAGHPLLPRSPLSRLEAYRSSRIAAEATVLGVGDADIQAVVVRPKTFLGPGRVGGFYLIFDLIRRGAVVPLLGPGGNRYQLLDVRDLAEALRRLVTSGGGGIYHLGASSFGTVTDDLGTLADHAGTGARLRPLPAAAGRLAVRAVELAGAFPLSEWHHCTARREDSVVDIGRAETELGWQPVHTNDDALVAAYDWYAEQRSRSSTVQTTHPVPATHRMIGRLAGLAGGRR